MDIGEIKISLNDNMQEIHDLVENQTITKSPYMTTLVMRVKRNQPFHH